MAQRHFESVSHANLYGKYRPIPPTTLINRVVDYLKEKYDGPLDTAYDVGAGSGQSTGFLSPYFTNVIGTDVSSAQIENANKTNECNNVKFEVSQAEKINADDRSVQVVTACQAAHWFDLPAFYNEVHRVLVPNGVLALYGYEFPGFVTGDAERDEKLDARLLKIYSVELAKYQIPREVNVYLGKYLADQYQFGGVTINGNGSDDEKFLLFKDFTREEGHFVNCETTLRDMIQYGLTWSGYQKYLKKEGEDKANDLMANYEKDLLEIFSSNGKSAEDIHFTRRTKYFLLMGRKL